MSALHRSLLCAGLCAGALALVACSEGTAEDDGPIPFPGSSSGSSGGANDAFATPPTAFTGGTIAGAGGLLGGLEPPTAGPPVRLGALRTAAKSPPPISGGTLAVDGAGTIAVAADPDRDTVYLVNLSEGDVRKVKLAAGSEPGRVALDGSKTAFIALRGTGKLAQINLSDATSNELDVCSYPRGVVVDKASGRVIVSCLDGQLVQFDLASGAEVARTADLPTDLRDVIVGASGVEAVARYRSAELLRLDGKLAVKSSALPRKGQRFGTQIVRSGPLADDAGTGLAPNGALSMAPQLAWRALRASNGNVWMMHQQSQEAQVVTSSSGGYGSGGCQTITGGKVSELDPQGNTVRSMTVPLLGLSVDAALSPNGKWLAIASPGAYMRSVGTLQVFATTSMQANQDIISDCQQPTHSSGDENQTTSVTFDDNNVLYSFSREPAELAIFVEPQIDTSGTSTRVVLPPSLFGGSQGQALTRKASIALDLSSARDTGHDLFHADVGQGIACASCHGEALDDAHVWDFEKIGPRRTQNMRGGLLATAPFHWDGDMMSINHLVDEVMTRRMGGFQVMKPFQDALGGWIDRQPALTLPAANAAAVARGQTLFNAAGTQCATCHSGKNFTNNQSKDVGTGGVFQVPSLLGLALRAPYMHTGCATTIEDRFTASCGGGDKHGMTSNLSKTQIADLVAYLKTL